MTVKSDKWIERMALERGMISPFEAEQVRQTDGKPGAVTLSPIGVISYGLSSFGYDMRVADEYKVFYDTKTGGIVDPKNFDPHNFMEVRGKGSCIVPPNSFALGYSIERFKIPKDVLALVIGKSTYARCGIVVNCTPMEPCLSSDSQVLTSTGWVGIADVKVGDFLLTRREDGKAEYRSVERKQEREFKGKLLHFKGKSVDQLVTPDHKLFAWQRNPRARTYRAMTIEASEVFGKHGYQLDRTVEWEAPEPAPNTVSINGLSFNTDAFMRFLGCYLGDGSAYHGADGGYHVKLAAVTKERKFVYFKRVLGEMGIEARCHDRGFEFYSKPLATYLMQFGHAGEKFVDRQWLSLPAQKLSLLLEGLLASDGTQSTRTYTTTSQRLADDVQEIVFKTGAGAIVRKVREAINDGEPFDAYKIRVVENTTHKINPSCHR